MRGGDGVNCQHDWSSGYQDERDGVPVTITQCEKCFIRCIRVTGRGRYWMVEE